MINEFYIRAEQRRPFRGRCDCCKLETWTRGVVVGDKRPPVELPAGETPSKLITFLCRFCINSIRQKL